MTDLRNRVVRRTVDAVPAIRRRLVVMLEPGDVLAFREAGRRHVYRAPLGRVFTLVARWNVDAERAARRAARASRK